MVSTMVTRINVSDPAYKVNAQKIHMDVDAILYLGVF